MTDVNNDRQEEELFMWEDETLGATMCAYISYDGREFGIEICKVLEDGTIQINDEVWEMSPRWSFMLELLAQCGVGPETIIKNLKLFTFDDGFDDIEDA